MLQAHSVGYVGLCTAHYMIYDDRKVGSKLNDHHRFCHLNRRKQRRRIFQTEEQIMFLYYSSLGISGSCPNPRRMFKMSLLKKIGGKREWCHWPRFDSINVYLFCHQFYIETNGGRRSIILNPRGTSSIRTEID